MNYLIFSGRVLVNPTKRVWKFQTAIILIMVFTYFLDFGFCLNRVVFFNDLGIHFESFKAVLRFKKFLSSFIFWKLSMTSVISEIFSGKKDSDSSYKGKITQQKSKIII